MSTTLLHDAPLPYLHAGATDAPRRLLVLAHGVGGNEQNLAPLAADAPGDTAVLLPRAPLTLGPGQYAWFPVAFTAQGPQPDFDAAEASRTRLVDFVAAMQARLGIAAASTVVAGFSQGGIMSASVALTQPDRVAGFGLLAGRILPELAPRIASRGALAHLHAFIGHGRDDTTLPIDWAHKADSWLDDLGVAHDLRLYPGGHAISASMRDDVLAWFDRITATPPDTV